MKFLLALMLVTGLSAGELVLTAKNTRLEPSLDIGMSFREGVWYRTGPRGRIQMMDGQRVALTVSPKAAFSVKRIDDEKLVITVGQGTLKAVTLEEKGEAGSGPFLRLETPQGFLETHRGIVLLETSPKRFFAACFLAPCTVEAAGKTVRLEGWEMAEADGSGIHTVPIVFDVFETVYIPRYRKVVKAYTSQESEMEDPTDIEN